MLRRNQNDNIAEQKKNSAAKIVRISLIAVLCLLTALSVVFLERSVKTYHIVSGNEKYDVCTVATDLPQALSNTDLQSDQYRIVSSSASGKEVDVEYVFPVYITVDNETEEFLTAGGTVAEILAEAGYTVDEFDLIQPAADQTISEMTYIDYTNIDYKTVTEKEAIAHKTVTVSNSNLEKGKEKVTEGKDGVRQITYRVKYVNGVETSRTESANEVLTQAVDTKREVGTKVATAKKTTTKTTTTKTTTETKQVAASAQTAATADTGTVKAFVPNKSLPVKQRVLAVVGKVSILYHNGAKATSQLLPTETVELDANNRPIRYSKKITVQATAYTHTGHNCSTGVKPVPGYIAVNPNQIPYGTKMYIVSSDGKFLYGYAVAADTGGFAKSRPTNVDLFYDTLAECYQFGRRNVDIYFLP